MFANDYGDLIEQWTGPRGWASADSTCRRPRFEDDRKGVLYNHTQYR